MATRLQIAKPDIVKALDAGPSVLRKADLAHLFNDNREFWRLAQGTSLQRFIDFLIEKTNLKRVRLPFPQREVVGYTWGHVPLLETLLGLVSNSHYSHYTAMRIHGLTEQIPKTIYLSQERSDDMLQRELALYDQENIDLAFSRAPRVSKNEIEILEEGCRVVMLKSRYHSGLGVVTEPVNYGGSASLLLRYTDLERTMIDIVTRPFYAGGLFEVANAFERARGSLSVNKMSAMLAKMDFGYPYHQAVGYYLERSGYKESLVDIFRRLPMERDFYISYGIGKKAYVSQWRLYVPEGF